jgi:hypothetical protein
VGFFFSYIAFSPFLFPTQTERNIFTFSVTPTDLFAVCAFGLQQRPLLVAQQFHFTRRQTSTDIYTHHTHTHTHEHTHEKKMPPKASSLSSKESADPMLQDTYLQDDTKDFEPSTDEIAAFEERLQHGGSAAPAAHSGNPRRHSAPVPEHPRPSNHVAPSAGHHISSAAHRGAGQRRVSEAEQEEAMQHKEDVDDVRHLDARFGNAHNGDDDSN